MKKPLAHFRHMTRHTIANLEGMKSIMRVETAQTVSWWLVLPCSELDDDHVCVLIKKVRTCKYYRNMTIASEESKLRSEYDSRIVTA